MYLKVLKQEERFGLCFWTLNNRQKGTTNAFTSYKQKRKLYLVCLDVKLQQNKYSCCI